MVQSPDIQLSKLLDHIQNTHPVKLENNKIVTYGMCSDLGRIPLFQNLTSKPTLLAKELGVGATLFLMSTRAMAWLFFVLSVINIPVFLFYWNGTSTKSHNPSK